MNKKPTAVASRGFVEIFILATTSTLGIGGYYYPGYQNYQRLSDLQEHFGKNTNGTAEVKQSIQRFFSGFKLLVVTLSDRTAHIAWETTNAPRYAHRKMLFRQCRPLLACTQNTV